MFTFTSPGTTATDGPIAIVLIDLYSDFDTLAEHDTIAHLHQVVTCARKHNIPIYYGLHQQWKPGFYQAGRTWRTYPMHKSPPTPSPTAAGVHRSSKDWARAFWATRTS